MQRRSLHFRVACRQLGFATGIPRTDAFFGQGPGDVVMGFVSCTGSERYLSDCPMGEGFGWDNIPSWCGHVHDSGVECLGW